jgi:amino acid transporter
MPGTEMLPGESLSVDEQRLAELGYRQELHRGWSRFSNFAISFTIISVLAGPFTTFSQAWNNGGPPVITIGWPVITIFVLAVGFSMSELASAFPTAGGIYYWAHRLGGASWAWFTGWFNLLGLIAIVASVGYAAAIWLNTFLGLYNLHFLVNWGTTSPTSFAHHSFDLFVVILLVMGLVNVFSSPLVALFNRMSVWWHVLGVALIVGILFGVPDHHQSFSFAFTHRLNLSGFNTSMYWFYILPVGFLLTMYTFTGYDASAHISEETHDAAMSAPKGLWRSIFYSGLVGWVVLLALVFAATHVSSINTAGGTAQSIIETALTSGWAKVVILISTVGQLFCTMGCIAAASRMSFAFSRDGAIPGHQLWRRLNKHRTPTWSVLFVSLAALAITWPAFFANKAGTPVAFYAVTQITTIGLYVAYTIPVYLRWRKGDSFEPGPWNLGKKYKWINLVAIIWVGLNVLIFSLPAVPAGVWFKTGFSWTFANYSPLVNIGVFLAVAIWWVTSAKNTFHGPVRTIDQAAEEPGRLPPTPPPAPAVA